MMVDKALADDVALVRVVNSRNEAEDLLSSFKKADPPVRMEIYDSKNDEVIVS